MRGRGPTTPIRTKDLERTPETGGTSTSPRLAANRPPAGGTTIEIDAPARIDVHPVEIIDHAAGTATATTIEDDRKIETGATAGMEIGNETGNAAREGTTAGDETTAAAATV